MITINSRLACRRFARTRSRQCYRAEAWGLRPSAGPQTPSYDQGTPATARILTPLLRNATLPFSFQCPPPVNNHLSSSVANLPSGQRRSSIVIPIVPIPDFHCCISDVFPSTLSPRHMYLLDCVLLFPSRVGSAEVAKISIISPSSSSSSSSVLSYIRHNRTLRPNECS